MYLVKNQFTNLVEVVFVVMDLPLGFFPLVELWCLRNFFNTKIQRSKVHFPCPNASHETLLLPAAVAAMPSGNMVREKVTGSRF